MSAGYIVSRILVMAAVTYAIRLLPLVLFRREIKSRFMKSFLFYIPFACLAAMVFPDMLYATDSRISAVISFAAAVILGLKKKSLLVVALSACAVVFLVERILVLTGMM